MTATPTIRRTHALKLEDASFQQLVDAFAESTVAQDAAKTATEGNKHARHRTQIFSELTKRGDAGREALTQLFSHDDPHVRCMTAVYLLRYAHDESIAILHDLADGQGMVAFAARQSIKNWHNGDWQIDPDPQE